MSLLRACSGAEAFMKRNQGRVTAQKMVSFLLFEPTFPRSLRYCLRSGQGLLLRVWEASGDMPHPSIERLARLLDWLDDQAAAPEVGQIHKLLTTVVDETSAICSSISQEIQGPSRASVQTQSQTQGEAPA